MNFSSLIVGIILATIMYLVKYLIDKFNKNSKKDLNASNSERGKIIVDTLESLDYFKYTSPENLDTLKKEIAETYVQYQVLTTVNDEKGPYYPHCNRFYFCDGETLFELGGIENYLNDVKQTFNLMGISLVWSEVNFNHDATEQTIVVNGKKYFTYKGDPNDPRAWGIATKNFVNILNDQLTIHNSNERVYPILFNNDGRIVFLTEPQYRFIFENFNKREKPMDVELWWETFK
jgi:hypothetical protein